MPGNEIMVHSASEQSLLRTQLDTGALVVDPGRRRPFYFDGRFLTASDLIADQDYVRARQSDLAQAIGAGVIRGLMPSIVSGAGSQSPLLRIAAGSGVTPSGDLVSLASNLELRLDDIPASTELDAQLGIKMLPQAATRNRSGLFVLALRPIEFSANPVPAYPTSLDGVRTVRDGDIIEATAVTLIPYPDRAGVENADAKRARVAREIFFDRVRPGALQDALPIAMLCLEGGALRWLDAYMVRREVGAESTLAAGLAQRPRALVEAWLKQYQDQLDDVDTAAVQSGFAATRYFEVLPPVGPLPAATLYFEEQLGRMTLLQSFFPPVVDVEFAFIPSDELAALVQDALALPPIDLHAGDEDLDHLSVLVVAPVTRQDLEANKRSLQTLVRPVRAAAAGMLAKRSPFETLVRIAQPLPPPGPQEQQLAAAWQSAVERARAETAKITLGRGLFWYLRKRQLPYTSEIAGTSLRLTGDAASVEAELKKRIEADQRVQDFDKLSGALPRLAQADLVNLLAAPRFALSPTLPQNILATSDILRRSAFGALLQARDAAEAAHAAFDHAAVLKVARAYGDPNLGQGIDALLQAADAEARGMLVTPKAAKTIEASGVAPELDRAARLLPVKEQPGFAADLARAADAGNVEALRTLAGDKPD
jgi:hypothetical protein